MLRGGPGLFYDRPNASTTTPAAGNPPTAKSVTVRYGQLQSLGRGGLTTEGAPALGGLWEYESGGLPTSTQWTGGMQMCCPGRSSLDVSYVGQHSSHGVQTLNLNAIDFSAAFLPQNQDPTLPASTTPGATAKSTDLMRAMPGYSTITQMQQNGWNTYHSLQVSFQRRFRTACRSASTTRSGSRRRPTARRGCSTTRTDRFHPRRSGRRRQAARARQSPGAHHEGELRVGPARHQKQRRPVAIDRATSPTTGSCRASGPARRAAIYRHLQLSERRHEHEPDRFAGLRRADQHRRRSRERVQQRSLPAVQYGGVPGTAGEQRRARIGNDYMRSCFTSVFDLAIARNIRLGGARNLQLRVDMFNAPNSAIITGGTPRSR